MEINSNTPNDTLFENIFTDNEKLFDHFRVFKKDRYLTKTITKKFENGFLDEKLNNKCYKIMDTEKIAD